MIREFSADHELLDGFAAREFQGKNGVKMPFRIFAPDERSRPLPLVVYLHGGSGAGTDNVRQISGYNAPGTHLWTRPELRERHPAFVLAPQLPGRHPWSDPDSEKPAPYAGLVLELLDLLVQEFPIDPDRIYLAGHSRGGRGTWDLICKRPDRFAAAIPVCGDGNPDRVPQRPVPVWAFHGAKDETIPVTGSREMVSAFRKAGGSVRYTEYPDAGHDVWDRAFAEPELPGWLFAQKRRAR